MGVLDDENARWSSALAGTDQSNPVLSSGSGGLSSGYATTLGMTPEAAESAYKTAKAARTAQMLATSPGGTATAKPGQKLASMFRPNYTTVTYRHDWQKSGLRPEATAALSSILTRVSNVVPAIEVASAYRPKAYNRKVGGASKSQHVQGRAFDVSLGSLAPDQQQALVSSILEEPSVAGFGYYPKSNSIHFDVRPGGKAYWGPSFSKASWKAPGWMDTMVKGWATGRTAPVPPRDIPMVAANMPTPRPRPDRTGPTDTTAVGYAPMSQDQFNDRFGGSPAARAITDLVADDQGTYRPATAISGVPAQRRKPTSPTATGGVTIKRGDTLWAIAAQTLGDGNRWREIAAANGIRDPRALKVGQKIVIPGSEVDIPLPRANPRRQDMAARANRYGASEPGRGRGLMDQLGTFGPADTAPASISQPQFDERFGGVPAGDRPVVPSGMTPEQARASAAFDRNLPPEYPPRDYGSIPGGTPTAGYEPVPPGMTAGEFDQRFSEPGADVQDTLAESPEGRPSARPYARLPWDVGRRRDMEEIRARLDQLRARYGEPIYTSPGGAIVFQVGR